MLRAISVCRISIDQLGVIFKYNYVSSVPKNLLREGDMTDFGSGFKEEEKDSSSTPFKTSQEKCGSKDDSLFKFSCNTQSSQCWHFLLLTSEDKKKRSEK